MEISEHLAKFWSKAIWNPPPPLVLSLQDEKECEGKSIFIYFVFKWAFLTNPVKQTGHRAEWIIASDRMELVWEQPKQSVWAFAEKAACKLPLAGYAGSPEPSVAPWHPVF